MPAYLNRPLAANATQLYHAHFDVHRLTREQFHAMCTVAQPVNTPGESRCLNTRKGPMIIVSASGMATGGRLLHHFKQFAPDARNALLFAGFQAGGTRGAAIVGGADSVKIHGECVPMRAVGASLRSLAGVAACRIIWRR